MTLVPLAVVSVAAALLLLRGRTLWRWAACEIAAWLLFALLVAVARPLGVSVDPRLAVYAFGVLKLGMLFAFVAFANDVRWSATRAAVVALLIYILVIFAMLPFPIDGDEPFYLLMTESMVKDHDLDLANQYRDLAHSATHRLDLVPQTGDRTGPHGESYSRLEPFLALLMMPGFALAGLSGALLTIALFGALLVRSTIRLFEDEGISDATARQLFPLVAFGPPIVFYATRIWPEVPAAWCFVEAVRGVRQRRAVRWGAALLGLVFLKLRFGLIAIVLLLRQGRRVLLGAVILIVLAVAFALSAHKAWELRPGPPYFYLLGITGLAVDGAAGIAFQAPLYLFGLIALARWKSMPAGFRLGMAASLLYLIYLFPRTEWHGGWSPPLRYVVVVFPILALGAAALWERIAAGPKLAVTAWTLGLVIHGLVFPYRLFHIADGQSPLGDWLGERFHADVGRLIPSTIRPNLAALVAGVLLVVMLILFRSGRTFTPAVAALLVALFIGYGRRPGERIQFEDTHVTHAGGELYPTEYQAQRFLFTGGWIVRAGDSMKFLARDGRSKLRYQSAHGATIQIASRAYVLPPTRGAEYATVDVDVPSPGCIELRCLAGAANLDRMDHE
ncbi:MAG TPA: hypothetical protein VJZ76_13235 [Thermoanaerobaculia bacterium]|nr:hypothetical protein [Thermoanaerobaculia bacterium]